MKRIFAIILSVALCTNMICFSAYTPELNITASKTTHTISPGLKYINSVEVCENVRQEIFTFEFTPGLQTEIAAVYGQYIYGFNSVGSLITSYDGEDRVVGGINTDFFITNTGIPLSCLVADNEIVSSCDNRVAIGFDQNGTALIGNPEIKAEILSSDGMLKIPIAHINKTPAIWGAYLVTDKFNSTTKSSVDSIEIVLRPISYISENEASITEAPDMETSESVFVTYSSIDEIYMPPLPSSGPLTNEYLPDDSAVDIEGSSDEYEDLPIDAEEDISTEKVILRAGTKINVIVEDIRYNISNGEIPEGCFVVCIPTENFSYLADGINLGDKLVVNTTCNQDFAGCVNIFGAGTRIIENGVKIEQENNSVFIYKQPRTAAGIKEDGTVIFVCVDGRNPGVSSGYTITELSDYLLSQGCVDAVNFDGGGSTTFYAADIGELNPKLKNSPSDGFERRVADGLIFVNMSPSVNQAIYAAAYPSKYYVYHKGTTMEFIPEILFADFNYHPVSDIDFTYQLYIPEKFGTIVEGQFTPSGIVGNVPIDLYADNGIVFDNVGEIIITDFVDKVNFEADDKYLTPFEYKANLSLSASLHTIPVYVTPESADIVIYKRQYDNIHGEQLILADESEIHLDKETFTVYPINRDETYVISLSLGGVTKEIEIYAEKYPFDDMESHWASVTSYDMYKNGLFIGEISQEGSRLFYPERNMTRAEFCVVLSRLLGLNADSNAVSEETPEIVNEIETSDEVNVYSLSDVPDWAKSNVKVLYDAGFLDELLVYDENNQLTLFAEEIVTRMDVIRVLGSVIMNQHQYAEFVTSDANIFYDFVPEKESDIIYVQLMHDRGIMQGYEDGSIRQNDHLTRAEAATVFSRFLENS